MEMVDKKKFEWFSYSSSKWVIKQQRQLTASMHLAQELITNVQCSGSARSFAKETRALNMRSIVDGLQKLTTTIWEQSLKLILLQLHEKLPKNSMLTILWSLSIWSKLERWKSHKWVPHELTENKKIVVLKSCLLLFYATTTTHFAIGLWQEMKSGFYMTTSDNQLSGWTKKIRSTYQSQTCTKKGQVTLRWSATCLIH